MTKMGCFVYLKWFKVNDHKGLSLFMYKSQSAFSSQNTWSNYSTSLSITPKPRLSIALSLALGIYGINCTALDLSKAKGKVTITLSVMKV